MSILKAAPAGRLKGPVGEVAVGGRPIYTVGLGVPQVGTLAFGVVDRGTNVLKVKPTSVCALSCIFCSVNAGPQSRARWAEYVVEVEALLSALVAHTSVFRFYLNPAYT